MKRPKLGLLTKVAVLALSLGIVVAAYAQETKQAAFLTINDPAAAAKILEVLKKSKADGYVFTGMKTGVRGRKMNFSQGALSLAQVKQTAKFTGVSLPKGSNAIVHSSITDFFFKQNLDKIKVILKEVDKNLYKLDVVQVKR